MARIQVLVALLGISLCACRGTELPDSVWPPDNFYLEVRGRQLRPDATVERQSLHVFADGLVVYREADPGDAFPGEFPPVFSKVSAYRLRRESLRTLARSLDQAGLFQLEAVVGVDATALDVVALRCRAFDRDFRAVGRGRVYGEFTDVLHVINSFLPAGCSFTLPDMTGEPQSPRLSGAPAPARDVAGAFAFHQSWAELWSEADFAWRCERIGLALRAGERGVAQRLVQQVEGDFARSQAAFDDVGTRQLLSRLRQAVADTAPR